MASEDHHAADRGRKVRTPDEIREHINADHPCCIGVGDACALLEALKQAHAETDAAYHRETRLEAEVERLRAALNDPASHYCKELRAENERLRASNREWRTKRDIIAGLKAKIDATLAIPVPTLYAVACELAGEDSPQAKALRGVDDECSNP